MTKFWVIFTLIWVCSLVIHIAIVYYTSKPAIFTIGDLIDKIESFMWFPFINTLVLIVLGAAFIGLGTASLLKLDALWERFRNIKLK